MARTLLFSFLGVAIVVLAGCKDDGPDIVRLKPRHIDPPEKDRLLAVLVTEKDKAWSIKMSGPVSAVTAHLPKFEQLIHSIKFGDQPPVKWKVPDGWKEEGGNEVRFATIKTSDAPKMLEVTVVSLPKDGGEVLANVNRWRGQMSLPAAKADDLADMTKTVDVDGRKGTMVDLVGKATGKMPMAQAAAAKKREAPAQANAKKISYELPDGWVKAKPKNVVIREQFEVIEGGAKLETTIVELPEGAGGEIANLHRWREQIKLPPAKNADEILKMLTKIETKAGPAAFVDLDNPQAPGDNRILGVMVPAPGATYFLKMMGPSELVGQQKARFEAFAKSFNVQ